MSHNPSNPLLSERQIAALVDAVKHGDLAKAQAAIAPRGPDWTEYDQADSEVTVARKLLEATLDRRSDVVKRLAERHGPGPFAKDGIQVLLVSKPNGTRGVVTYFLRSARD